MALQATACTAEALVHFLFNVGDSSRGNAKVEFALRWLQKLALHSVGYLNRAGGGQLRLAEGFLLGISSQATLDMTSVNPHVQVSASLKAAWDQLDNIGEWTNASLLDVVRFAAMARRTRRAAGRKPFSARSSQAIQHLQIGLAKFLSQCLVTTVNQIIQNTVDIEHRQIPSRKRQNQADTGEQLVLQEGEERAKRHHVNVDVDAIWEMIQESEDTGVSLGSLSRTKKNEKQGGCSEHTVKHWIGKHLSMYASRARWAFEGVKYFNLLTDSSTFSTRDTCISALYSTERDLGAYLPLQLVKGNSISPNELHLDPSVERMVAIRKADRVASYRLLQALSNQLSQMSNRKVSISSFLLSDGTPGEEHPLALALRPLSPNHLRIVERFPNGDFKRVQIMDKRQGVLLIVSLRCYFKCVSLVFGLSPEDKRCQADCFARL